jgi:hypothetical protein
MIECWDSCAPSKTAEALRRAGAIPSLVSLLPALNPDSVWYPRNLISYMTKDGDVTVKSLLDAGVLQALCQASLFKKPCCFTFEDERDHRDDCVFELIPFFMREKKRLYP